jgi:hypothetical protein
MCRKIAYAAPLYFYGIPHNAQSAELHGLLFKIQFPACGFSGEFHADKTHLKKGQSYTRAELEEREREQTVCVGNS